MRHGFHQTAECVVVVGDEKLWRRLAWCQPPCGRWAGHDRREGRHPIASPASRSAARAAEIVQPDAEARSTAKSRVRDDRRDHRIEPGRRSCRQITLGDNGVGRKQVESAIDRAEVALEGCLGRQRHDRRRQVGIKLLLARVDGGNVGSRQSPMNSP